MPLDLGWFEDDDEDYGFSEDSAEEDEPAVVAVDADESQAEKKYLDIEIGGYITPFVINPNVNITRNEWDLTPMKKGYNNAGNRIGNNIQVERLSVRMVLYLQPFSTTKGITGDGFVGVEYRIFVFQDRSAQYAGTMAKSLGGTGAVGSFDAKDSFLSNARMNSFYNMDNIKKFRIFADTGVQHFIPKMSRMDMPFCKQGDNPFADNVLIAQEDVRLSQPLISNTRTGNFLGTNEVKGDMGIEATINLVAAAPAGVGTIDGAWSSVPLLNYVTFPEVVTQTNVSNPATALLTSYGNNASMSRTVVWKPMPGQKSFEWNIPVDITTYYPDTSDVSYPIKNGLRVGVIVFSTQFNVGVVLDTRVLYTDD